MILSGTLIGFICVLALLFTSFALVILEKKEKKKGNLEKSRLLSGWAVWIFIVAFLGGVAMTLVSGLKKQHEEKGPPKHSMTQRQLPLFSPTETIGRVDQKEVKRLQEKVDSDPHDVRSRERLGHLYLQLGDMENVFRMAHEALQIDPKSAESRAHMGLVLFSMRQVDEALKQFDLALENDPNNLEALLHKGMVQYQGQNDLKGAKASWEKYLKMTKPTDPGHRRVKMMMKMLEKE